MKIEHNVFDGNYYKMIVGNENEFFDGKLTLRNAEKTGEGFFVDIYIGKVCLDQIFMDIEGNVKIGGLYFESQQIGVYKNLKMKYTVQTMRKNVRTMLVQYLNNPKFYTIEKANTELRKVIPQLKSERKNAGNSEYAQYLRNYLVVLQRVAHNCL